MCLWSVSFNVNVKALSLIGSTEALCIIVTVQYTDMAMIDKNKLELIKQTPEKNIAWLWLSEPTRFGRSMLLQQ